jgi:hypothetical protein
MRKRREVDYGYDGPDWNSLKEYGDYNGNINSESGPSRITINDLERMEMKRHVSRLPSPSLSRRKRHIALGVGLALPFLTLAAAAPPIYRDRPPPAIAPTPTPNPSHLHVRRASASTIGAESRIDEEDIEYDIKYLTSMSTPTQALPTEVYIVAETRLPFYLSQDPEGSWSKVDNAWFLYGRQAGVGLLRVNDLRTIINDRSPPPTLARMKILLPLPSLPLSTATGLNLPSLMHCRRGT